MLTLCLLLVVDELGWGAKGLLLRNWLAVQWRYRGGVTLDDCAVATSVGLWYRLDMTQKISVLGARRCEEKP